jgi:hypothetical protein
MPRVLLDDREFRRRLGQISKTGLYRLRQTDPRCPRPTKVMGKNATDQAEADVFIELLLAEREPLPHKRLVGAKDDLRAGAGP